MIALKSLIDTRNAWRWRCIGYINRGDAAGAGFAAKQALYYQTLINYEVVML